jgi:hypothetical protein
MAERSLHHLRRALSDPSAEPIGAVLDDDLDEGRVKAMWQHIDHAPRRRPGVWLLAAAALVLLALASLAALRDHESGRLALVSGASPGVLGADSAPATPRFDDGSLVSLTQGSRLEVLRNDRRSFVTALRRGAATFDVKPGGRRHWIVEAGELSVEVVGTRFRVERQSESTTVSVQHGIVLVRGERVPGGSVRLTAGKSFELRGPVAVASSSSAPPVAALVSSDPPLATHATAGAAGPPPDASARPDPIVADARDDVERSLQAADAARSRHDHAAAAAHFEAAWLEAAPGDPRRGLAALSLARSVIAANPAKAARLLRSSLADMPQTLLEDALARLVEAEGRSGNSAGAARAAAEYLRQFPTGRRAEEVERWSRP